MRGETRALGARTWLMGVLNVTPDSFSDGGRFAAGDAAVERGLALFEQGADVVDVGGESTRPGAVPVPAETEIERVVPVIAGLRRRGPGLVSIDTTKAAVARAALDAGADIVNDVSGLLFDPELGGVAAAAGAPLVLMHLRGKFATMHESPFYADVGAELISELRAALARAAASGVDLGQTLVDPGIGFSKDAAHSVQVLARLDLLHALGRPVLVGPSRKSFIGQLTGAPAGERLFGTAAAVTAAILQGAHVVRVHDVALMAQAAKVSDALLEAGA
ncbi:MAG: dihydropteroate synthase [Vicinamibacteria bacterium]|nr:dihydropteroate synthase [Vicinamibacteria bacterium]